MERHYQPEIECASREQLRAWQSQRLVAQVRRVWENVPYYRKKMEEKGVTPEDIRGVEDLPKLPFLSKADLLYQALALPSLQLFPGRALDLGLVVVFHSLYLLIILYTLGNFAAYRASSSSVGT